jgi:hypothetical protein
MANSGEPAPINSVADKDGVVTVTAFNKRKLVMADSGKPAPAGSVADQGDVVGSRKKRAVVTSKFGTRSGI